MTTTLRPLMRLVIAVLFALVTYWVLGFSLDKLSTVLARDSSAREVTEVLLAMLAPVTFGFVVLLVLVVTFYVLLPRWFPRLAGGSAGTSKK